MAQFRAIIFEGKKTASKALNAIEESKDSPFAHFLIDLFNK